MLACLALVTVLIMPYDTRLVVKSIQSAGVTGIGIRTGITGIGPSISAGVSACICTGTGTGTCTVIGTIICEA